MTKRILLLGATGRTGRLALEYALSQGIELLMFSKLATTCETCYFVIPAKAGIQAVDIAPRSGTTPSIWFCPLRGII